MEQFKNIQWVVQRNLTNPADFEGMRRACEQSGIPFVPLDIIPFTTELPSFDRSRRSIIYGSTTFNTLAREDASLREGIFFDESQFSIENYFHHWGRHMLNYGARITTFEELIFSNEYPGDKVLFIRPDDDNKSFAGEMKRYDEIKDWYTQLSSVEKFVDGKIVISEPYNIQYEWRLWIVNKRVIAASKYRHYFKLTKEEGCPDGVVAFAQARCEEYTPHDVFVMDICLCGDEYFIVECGGMNAAGFYKARIADIVNGVSAYFVSILKLFLGFLLLSLLPACILDFGSGTFTERSRTYSPDSTKFLLRYGYEQGAFDGGRSYFIAILHTTDSVESTADKYKFFSYDVDDVYWQGSDTVVVAEKFTEFVSRGRSSFKDSIFSMNGVVVKVVHKDPIDTSFERKVFYRETSPDQKYDLIVYRYVKPRNGYYFLNISVVYKDDSIPKFGNFYVSRFDFDCFEDIRWMKGDTLDIKVSESCFYSFEDYLVKSRDTGIKYQVQMADTIRGNIIE